MRMQQKVLISFGCLLNTRKRSRLVDGFAQWRDYMHDARQMQREAELQDQELERRRQLALTIVVRISHFSKRRAFRRWIIHAMQVAGHRRQQAHDEATEALQVSNILAQACGALERVHLRQMRRALSIWVDVVAVEARSELTRSFEKRVKLTAHASGVKYMVLWLRRKESQTLWHALRRWQRYVVSQREGESTVRMQQKVLISFGRLLVRADRQQQLEQTKLAWSTWHGVMLAQRHQKLRLAKQLRRLNNVSVRINLFVPPTEIAR